MLQGSRILDAGCGTGSYSVELAGREFVVSGLDSSEELISVARAKAEAAGVTVTFQVGDILELSSRPGFDGILCRGVLNDIVGASNRQQAVSSLAHALRKGGVFILDVREWSASAAKKKKEPVFERTVEVDNGTLTFRSVTRLEQKTRQLLVAESYILRRDDGSQSMAEYDFVMQCWTRDELHNSLKRAGVTSAAYLGDYDSGCPIGSTDRIVVVASV